MIPTVTEKNPQQSGAVNAKMMFNGANEVAQLVRMLAANPGTRA